MRPEDYTPEEQQEIARIRAFRRAGNVDEARRRQLRLAQRVATRQDAQRNDFLSGLSAAVANAIPFRDQIGAAVALPVQALTGQRASFDDNVARLSAQREELARLKPLESGAGAIGGGIATGGALVRAATPLVQGSQTASRVASALAPRATAPTIAGRTGAVVRATGRAALAGAPVGAAVGVADEAARTGNLDGAGGAALSGAAWGTVGGLAGEAAFAALRPLGSAVVNGIARMRAGPEKDKVLGEAARRTGMSVPDLQRAIAAYQSATQRDPALVELLDAPAQQAARAVSQQSDEAARVVARRAPEIASRQRQTLRDAVSPGAAEPQSSAQVRRRASEAYTAALRPIEARPVELTDELADFFKDPDVLAGIGAQARRRISAKLSGEDPAPFTIRDLENAAADLNKKFQDATGSAFDGRGFARQLRGIVGQQHAEYSGIAREFARQQDIAEGVTLGASAAQRAGRTPDVVDRIETANTEQAAGVRGGVQARMAEIVDQGDDQAAQLALRLAEDDTLRQRLTPALGAARVEQLSTLGRQLAQSRASMRVAAGGPVATAEDVASQQNQTLARIGASFAWGPAAQSAALRQLQQQMKMSPEAARQFAEVLFDDTPGVAQRAVAALERMIGVRETSNFLRRLLPQEAASVAGVVAQQQMASTAPDNTPAPEAGEAENPAEARFQAALQETQDMSDDDLLNAFLEAEAAQDEQGMRLYADLLRERDAANPRPTSPELLAMDAPVAAPVEMSEDELLNAFLAAEDAGDLALADALRREHAERFGDGASE